MIRKTCLAAAVIAFATPALSLSCMPPDVIFAYNKAAESEYSYIVVTGQLTFNEQKLPRAVINDSPPSTRIPAQLEGLALTKTGFDMPFDRAITLNALCFGPWCGGAESGAAYLAFLKRDNGSYVIDADPCSSTVFLNPTGEMMQQVEQCFAGGACGQ